MIIRHLKSVVNILVGYQSRARIDHNPFGTHRLILGRDFHSKDHLCTDSLLSFNPDRDPVPYTIKPGDVLFQARGSDHFAYCIAEPPLDTLAASSFYILRPLHKDLHPHFLAWWINQPPAQRYLQAESQSASMPFVSKTILSRLEIRIPDLQTQENIHCVHVLMQKETALRRVIAARRRNLIETICMNRICKQGAR